MAPAHLTKNGAIRVLIIDDHPLIRQGLRSAIRDSDDCELAGEAGSPAGIVRLVAERRPEVVILDIRLGESGSSGIGVARQLTGHFPALKVLVLSAHTLEPYVRELQRIGVHGILPKSVPSASVLDAVRCVVRGERIFGAGAGGHLGPEPGSPVPTPAWLTGQVTSREADVLQMFASGVSDAQIAGQLAMTIGDVQAILASAAGKLGADSAGEAVAMAAERGIIVVDDFA